MESIMNIRPYSLLDKSSCINVFKSNQPKYFSEYELGDFEKFLDSFPSNYYVIEVDNKIIGCGGIFQRSDKSAGLSWGMIDSAYHNLGYGKQLTLFRLAEIEKKFDVNSIVLDTCQHTTGFYSKLGFEITSVHINGIADGLHKCDMIKLVSS